MYIYMYVYVYVYLLYTHTRIHVIYVTSKINICIHCTAVLYKIYAKYVNIHQNYYMRTSVD